VQLAIRWLRSNAAILHGDPEHICAIGNSAGGHLAVFAGTANATIPGDFAVEVSGVSSRVQCVVTNAAPVDLTDSEYHPPDRQLFGSIRRDARAEREASPIFQIEGTAPPMLVIHGQADRLVPINQARRLVQELRRNGVPVQVIVHAGGHGLSELAPEERRAIAEAEIAFARSPRQQIPTSGYVWH
jgi:dipeptidyl aminopeptidase/acylaminoacyl peptidase